MCTLSVSITLFAFCLICGNAMANRLQDKSYACSTVALMKLLRVEDELVRNIRSYVAKLKNKHQLVHQALSSMRAKERHMKTDYEAYLGNPLNSFRLIHRLHRDWEQLVRYTSEAQQNERGHIEHAHRLRMLLPSALDLEEANRGIDSLVDIYELQPEDLAAGTLVPRDTQPAAALSPLDCLALGNYCKKERNDRRAEAWFNASLERYDEDRLEYVVFGLSRKSIHNSWGMLLMKSQQETAGMSHLNTEGEENSFSKDIRKHYDSQMMYKRACSAVFRAPAHLHCRYNSSTTAFARIAPLKMEELSHDPYMVLFHDVVYESEMDWLLNAKQLKASLVGHYQYSAFRTSKEQHFHEYYNEAVVKSIHRRLTDMTGLSLIESDALTLINYGMGGHYDLHHDSHNYSEPNQILIGDRIATVLLYVGEVDSGGATIFPYINVSVRPTKGSAVLWYNLDNTGEINAKAMHAGCPVVVGSKYVLTKWINEMRQLFLTPCIRNKISNPKSR
ncbi:prolyl 4-hydroxylase subunit alpha-2-like isoform X1 [Drosophila subobscura]|uniref:prolyl 4-hydroxylase subunit alpha-2-like isoform X1 n=2 Tax=Drosophila subobscura TaxID=7241 RepID=UPI00155A7FF0|nr:prolyl 4-hydroxylase subunit alpha-2-like isoform X1 [Drosophila subobscura]